MTIRPMNERELRYFADAHVRVYTEEYRWGPEFTDYAVSVAESFVRSERSEFYTTLVDGVPAGCIMLCETEDKSVGQLRLFLVEKNFRARGIGSTLIETLLDKAKQCNYRKIILWTASPLVDAIKLYEKFGFRKTEEQPNTSWSLDSDTVMEEKYELNLI